jgi:hypothetical protein
MKHQQTFEEYAEDLFEVYALIEVTLKNEFENKTEVKIEAYDSTEFKVLLSKGLENFDVVELRAIR